MNERLFLNCAGTSPSYMSFMKESSKHRPVQGQNPAAGVKPALLGTDLVWVQCKGYRCMAYSNPAGQWVSFYTGQVLTDAIEVLR